MIISNEIKINLKRWEDFYKDVKINRFNSKLNKKVILLYSKAKTNKLDTANLFCKSLLNLEIIE